MSDMSETSDMSDVSDSDSNGRESEREEKRLALYNKYKQNSNKEAKYTGRMKLLLTRSIDLKEASERGAESCEQIQEATYIVTEADDILRNAKSSNTAYLDAQVLYTSSIVYKICLEKLDTRINDFNPKEFAENILMFLENKGGKDNIWTAMEEDTTLSFNNTGGWTWQLGAVDIDEITPAQKPRNLKRDNLIDAPMKNPKKVQNLEKEEEDLENNMSAIMTAILKWENRRKEHLSFWKLVLNPTSFSETIENIFHVSHLVNEGLVNISLGREGLPVVKTIKSKGQKNNADRIPVAVSVNMKQWEDLVDAYEVRTPMIPARNHML